MANPFVHIELHSSDPAKSNAFLGELFDWELQAMPEMNYTMIGVGEDGTGGGITGKMPDVFPDAVDGWLPYVHVSDVAASLEKAGTLGAQVLVEKTEIPGMGFFGIISDPTGARLGLWEAASR